MHLQEGDEDKEVSTYGLEIERDELESTMKVATVYEAVGHEDDQFNGYEEVQNFFWARSCSECKIEMEVV
jgi:hypothetical protein